MLVDKKTVVCVGDGCLWPLLLLLEREKEEREGGEQSSQLPAHYYCLSNSSHSINMTKEVP